jgi:tetratricopeptide (TPR) repeat protein
MITPAQRRKAFVQAKQSAGPAPAINPHANAYELILAKLDSDKRRLHQVQSIERKASVKRELLPDYDAWVDGVLASGQGGQDDVVGTVMVWRIDVGDYAGALQIARYFLAHKINLPDNYPRPPACLVAEEIADAALREFSAGRGFPHEILVETLVATQDEDMPDQVRSRLIKADALAYEAAGEPGQALTAFQVALALNDKVGVKKDIERVKRALKNLAGQAPQGAPPAA